METVFSKWRWLPAKLCVLACYGWRALRLHLKKDPLTNLPFILTFVVT